MGIWFYRRNSKIKIVKDLAFSNHVVVWHIRFLEKFNLIKRDNLDNNEVFYAPKLDYNSVKRNYYTSKEKSEMIIKYLRQNDLGVSKTQLSRELNMHINTVTKYLTILFDYNILFKEVIDDRVLYFLNEE